MRLAGARGRSVRGGLRSLGGVGLRLGVGLSLCTCLGLGGSVRAGRVTVSQLSADRWPRAPRGPAAARARVRAASRALARTRLRKA